MTGRPFIDFNTAITDIEHFFGRTQIRDDIKSSPFGVKIIIGGSRLGKTSLLNALHFDLLNNENQSLLAFPVFFDFRQTLPTSRDNFFYLLIKCLEDSIREVKAGRYVRLAGFRQSWQNLISHLSGATVSFAGVELDIINPNVDGELSQDIFRGKLINFIQQLRRENFEGICFLFDNAEDTLGQAWADAAWGYFRVLKDRDDAIRPHLGLILSGYRDLKNYRQKVGSPFQNIGDQYRLIPLNKFETQALTSKRLEGQEAKKYDRPDVQEWFFQQSWGHPYLLQRLISGFIHDYQRQRPNAQALVRRTVNQELSGYFSDIWYTNSRPYSFGRQEQTIYSLLHKKKQADLASIQSQLGCSEREVKQSLDILCGMGVVHHEGNQVYIIGSRLFREWAKQALD